MHQNNLAVVLLAAGDSSRMGSSKQLLKIGTTTLLERSARCSMDAGLSNILVVLGARSGQHEEVLRDYPVTCVTNPEWNLGMGNSLKFGVRGAVEKWPIIRAVLIMVCDQPLLTSLHLRRLIDSWESSGLKAIASQYANTLGVPVVFDSTVFNDLMKIPDDRGAGVVIGKFKDQVAVVPFPGGEIDLDKPEDYDQYMAT